MIPKVLNNALKLIKNNQPVVIKLHKNFMNQTLSFMKHVEEHNDDSSNHYDCDYKFIRQTIKDVFKLPMENPVKEN